MNERRMKLVAPAPAPKGKRLPKHKRPAKYDYRRFLSPSYRSVVRENLRAPAPEETDVMVDDRDCFDFVGTEWVKRERRA